MESLVNAFTVKNEKSVKSATYSLNIKKQLIEILKSIKMKKISKLKLIHLDKDELEAKQMNILRGGDACSCNPTCGCAANCSCPPVGEGQISIVHTVSNSDSEILSSATFTSEFDTVSNTASVYGG